LQEILYILKNYLIPILDILAVAYLLYKTYEIIAETRAFLALKGLLLIVIVYLLSNILQMQTLNLILKLAISYGIIAIIVVFQPEIRRVLMRIGERSFSGLSSNVHFEYIGSIVRAVKFMSKKKIGSLIVITRKAGLKNIKNTGVKIDALISEDLIISIFYKNNPLHDGAIIIDGERIVAASCFLPLSESATKREYGTRHRAALGLSEDSDAIIIITSEETGIISVAVEGVLKSNYDETSLKNDLNRLLST